MKILIVKTSAIGDVTHTLPALNALKKHYPESEITWLIEEAASDIIKGHKALDRILISKRKTWAGNLKKGRLISALVETIKFIRQLRDTEYDLIIDFQNLLKSGILVWLARGKVKAGFGKGMAHSECSYIFLNKKIPCVDMNIHALDRELLLLKALGVECGDIVFNIHISEPDKQYIDNLMVELNVSSKGFLIGIHTEARWDTKLWDNKKFTILADELIKKYNADIVFTGSPGESSKIKEIISAMKYKGHNLAGKTDLKALSALYKNLDFLISTDTGPMHIAAAVGTPVVALFGPTAPYRTGPYGSQHKIIRANPECSPCFKRRCETIECMKRIEVSDVMDGIRELKGK